MLKAPLSPSLSDLSVSSRWRQGRTLQRPISLQGVGLHTGCEVSLVLEPSDDRGIWFERVDLPGRPRVRAIADRVADTQRSTTLGEGAVRIHTVEHLMAALHAASIDRCRVIIDGPELPAAGGCASPYVQMIEEAGIEELDDSVPVATLRDPIYWSEGQTHLIALPSDEFRISYTLHYPNCGAIGSQYYTIAVDFDSFASEIAPCRTYGHYHELEALRQAGLIRGGSLDCAVVIRDGVVVNEEGLRFPDEMVRHKILDLIGDLALVGRPFSAHVAAICSGHRSNCRLANKLLKHFTME